MDVFWMRRRPNFGDALAPVLVKRFAEVDARWAAPWRSDAVVIGSVATRLSRGYRGAVIGVGFLYADDRIDLRSAAVLGLRGALSRQRANLDGTGIVLGDPGLLAADLMGERPRTEHRLGIVPHFRDDTLARQHPDAQLIDVALDPIDVIGQIASCERIISSSLHGLIVADSFGIPRLWQPHPGVRGSGFKFADYATALGVELEPGRWATAPEPKVEAIRGRLRDAFAALPRAVADASRRRRGGMLRATERLASSGRPIAK